MAQLFLIIIALFAFCHNALCNEFYLNRNHINIDVNFKGTTLHLYGIKNAENIIIVFKGEKQNYTIQKKEKKFGIWIKGSKVNIPQSYQYYTIFAQKPLSQLKINHLLKEFELGIDNISSNDISKIIEIFEFKNAFLEKKIERNLFLEEYRAKLIKSHNLIYTPINIPQNIPEGNYVLSIYQISESQISSIHSIPVYIKQTGILKFVKNSSQNRRFLYLILTLGSSIGFALMGFIIFGGKWRLIKNIFPKKKPKKIKKRGRPKKKTTP